MIYDAPINKLIEPRVIRSTNGNISVIDNGMAVASWNQIKNLGHIAGQKISNAYGGYNIGVVNYKTKNGWLKGIKNRFNVDLDKIIEYKPFMCAKCGRPIFDKRLAYYQNKTWHIDCLKQKNPLLPFLAESIISGIGLGTGFYLAEKALPKRK